jgi:uncharacterized protein YecT (DUF1311 family)
MILWLAAAGTGWADEPVFDPVHTETCLSNSGGVEGPPTDCVGQSADICMSSALGSTTAGMNLCLEAEWQWWDARLNRTYRALMEEHRKTDVEMAGTGATVPSMAQALQAMQRAWIPFRDARCDYQMAQWGGGTGGGPALVGCLMAETGRQALYLEAQLGE